MNRRRFLATASAVALPAGCLSRDSAPPQASLDALWFVNHADDGADASVTVALDGEPVYEATFRLGPDVQDPDTPSNLTRDPDVDEHGAYVVRATVGDDAVELATVEWVDGDEDCILAKFVRSTTGTLHARPKSYENC